jgi:protein-S-isoprenylcysteine O-methyltransferase Ste14
VVGEGEALMLVARAFTRGLAYLAALAALLLVPAGLLGTWAWPRAWVFLALYGALAVVGSVALAAFRPESFRVRMQGLVAEKTKKQPLIDAVGTVVFMAYLAAWVAFMPLDVFRLRLLPQPPLWLSAVGAVACLGGAAVALLAVAQNRFAAPTVQDQSASGQEVVDTGLYGLIRHPLYAGNLLSWAGAALWLGSTAALTGVIGLGLFTAARIAVEEVELRRTLPGYGAYASRVRARLIPFVV